MYHAGYKKVDIPSCLGRSERWQRPVIWPRAHTASSKVESSSTILRDFWFCSYCTCKPAVFWDMYSCRQYNKNQCFRNTLRHTSTICAPGLMPTVWAGLPSDTWWTKTPVLLPPTTASWLSSASPWKEMLSIRPLTRMAFWRERMRKGGATGFDRLVREQNLIIAISFLYNAHKPIPRMIHRIRGSPSKKWVKVLELNFNLKMFTLAWDVLDVWDCRCYSVGSQLQSRMNYHKKYRLDHHDI